MSTPEEFLNQGNQFCEGGNLTDGIIKYRQGLESNPRPIAKMFLNSNLASALARLAGVRLGPNPHVPVNDRNIGYLEEAVQRYSEVCKIFDKEIEGTPEEGRFNARQCMKDAYHMAFSLSIFTDGFREKKSSAASENKSAKSGCFIATAAYGNYNSPEVVYLSAFRDDVLKRTDLGRRSVLSVCRSAIQLISARP